MYEVEQKFYVDSTQALRDRVTALGGVWKDSHEQVDRYFAHPSRDFADTDEALRLRLTSEAPRLTYKGPKLDRVTKTRREVEFALAASDQSAKACVELLEALGFRQVAEVRKLRVVATLNTEDRHFEVCLDEVEGLGKFAEIETLASEHHLDAARDALQALAGKLELTRSERRAYLELLMEAV